MVSRVFFIMFWIHSLVIPACRGEELSRELVLSWFREHILESLGLEGPPVATMQGPDGEVAHMHQRVPRTSRMAWVSHQTSLKQETSQIILFPSTDASCATSNSDAGETTNSHFTFYFQPSINSRETAAASADFWFYAGEGVTDNSSAPLFILTSAGQLLHAAEAPSEMSSDGWATYQLDHNLLPSVAEGPFFLQVRCPTCQCQSSEPDKVPFLHLRAHPRGPARSLRHAAAAATIPWSPAAIDLLQRPSQDQDQHSDCQRAEIQISFEELGWDNWIVHPKVLSFYYCHGNCSAWNRATTVLGITQCCAPVPGTMKSLRITTTSDGGYSFKYETLPNIIPEECTCI